MTAKLNADKVVSEYLRNLEREMDLFGSALPENRDRPPHNLEIIAVEEHDIRGALTGRARGYAARCGVWAADGMSEWLL